MMHCGNCGRPMEDHFRFCPFCGGPVVGQEGQEVWSGLVSRAKQGDQEALAALYQKSYSQVFYTIKSMIRDENAVFDILQDSYLKAFTHLKDFDGDSKFLPWVRQIAANTARDYLKKKKPTLFAELAADDAPDVPIEERFVDDHSEHMPDTVLDQAETTRLIREIIDSLPEDQRAVIGMYYYQEIPVKEIAAALGTSESAVKSRLLYARRKIESKVRDLEKKGTKLYGLAPLPFLLWLLRGQAAQAAPPPDGQILQSVLAQTGQPAVAAGASASGAEAGAAAAAGAKAVGGLSEVKLGLVLLACVAVICGGTVGISHLRGQAGSGSAPGESSSSPQAVQTSQADTAADDIAVERYGEIICNAPDYTYTDSDSAPTGYYRYAVIDTSISDQVPTLLLGQETENGNYYVRIFQYEPETDTVIQPERSLEEGSDGGGYHAGLSRGSQNAILLTETYGGSGDTEISSVTLAGGQVQLESQWSGTFDAVPEGLNREPIPWTEISFHGSGSGRIPPEKESPVPQKETPPPAASQSQSLPSDGDRIVFTGTIDTYTYEQVIELQGCPDPNAPWSDSSQTFRLIVLDTPQEMTLQSGDPVGSPRSGTVRLISVAYAEGLEQYDGQHLTFSIDPGSTYWPSDTSMPVGQPATNDVHVLD